MFLEKNILLMITFRIELRRLNPKYLKNVQAEIMALLKLGNNSTYFSYFCLVMHAYLLRTDLTLIKCSKTVVANTLVLSSQ